MQVGPITNRGARPGVAQQINSSYGTSPVIPNGTTANSASPSNTAPIQGGYGLQPGYGQPGPGYDFQQQGTMIYQPSPGFLPQNGVVMEHHIPGAIMHGGRWIMKGQGMPPVDVQPTPTLAIGKDYFKYLCRDTTEIDLHTSTCEIPIKIH